MQLENFSELSKVAAHPTFRDEQDSLQAPRSLQITHVIRDTLLLLFLYLTRFLRLQHTIRPSLRIQPVQARLH